MPLPALAPPLSLLLRCPTSCHLSFAPSALIPSVLLQSVLVPSIFVLMLPVIIWISSRRKGENKRSKDWMDSCTWQDTSVHLKGYVLVRLLPKDADHLGRLPPKGDLPYFWAGCHLKVNSFWAGCHPQVKFFYGDCHPMDQFFCTGCRPREKSCWAS